MSYLAERVRTLAPEAEMARLALDSVEDMIRIHEAAGDRELTRSQMADFKDAALVVVEHLRSANPQHPYLKILGDDPSLADLVAIRTKFARAIREHDRLVTAEALDNDPTVRAVSAAAATDGAPKMDTIRAMLAGDLPSTIDYDPFESRALESTVNVDHVPELANRIAFYMRTESPFVRLATISTGSTEFYVPRITADPTTYSPGQGTAISESSPTLTSVLATPKSYKAITYISQEMAQDSSLDLVDYIARSQARSISLAFNADASTAAWAGMTNGGTASGTPFYDLDDLIGLYYGLAEPYREKASWLLSNGSFSKIAKMKSSGGGDYLWEPNPQVGQPRSLLGGSCWEDPNGATPGSAIATSVAVGDWAAFLTIRQAPWRTAVSSEARFATDEIAVKTVWRAVAVPVLTDAVRKLVCGNS